MMPSSRTEWKVLLALAGLLLVTEVVLRLTETRLSKDVTHIRSLPREANLLRDASPGTLKVLVVGNSLARCGIDAALLATEVGRLTARPVKVAMMHPDGSRIEQWRHGYQRYFHDAGALPEVVILVTGRMHLSDAKADPIDLGSNYVATGRMWQVLRDDFHDIDARGDLVVSHFSALYAHRRRVAPRVLYSLVPHYDETAQLINNTTKNTNWMGGNEPALTHREFDRLASLFRDDGARLMVVTVAMPEKYGLPEPLQEACLSAGAMVLPLGAELNYSAERFPDHYHLDAQGAREFTATMLQRSSSLWTR